MQVGGEEFKRRDASKERSWDSKDCILHKRSPSPSVLGRTTWDFSIGKVRRIDLRGWPCAEVLDPLTVVERRAISDRICNEVTQAAADILREEQETRERLRVIHIKSVSLMSVAAVGLGFSMVYLHMVLVPFILAIFFFFLLEPLLYFILDPPGLLKRCVPGLARITAHFHTMRHGELAVEYGGASDNDAQNCGEHGRMMLMSAGMRIWGALAVIICMFVLLCLGAMVVFFIIQAVGDFPWNKYRDSEKLRLVLGAFPELAQDPDAIHFEGLLPWLLQGPLFNALDVTFSVVSQTFLTLLFVSFLLSNVIAPGQTEDPAGFVHKVRTSVQRYIRIKSLTSFAVSVAIGAFYWHMSVDLWFLFFVATFVLCYIPHVGNTVAVIMPLPLVFLDPEKTVGDLLLVFIAPFVVHQLTANLIEPKMLASSLDLHPIVVLLALAFWTTIWGAMGAILCVPLTAVVRLLLLEFDHPYALPIVNLLKGQLHATPRPIAKDSSNAPSGAASPSSCYHNESLAKELSDPKGHVTMQLSAEDLGNSATTSPEMVGQPVRQMMQPVAPVFFPADVSSESPPACFSGETPSQKIIHTNCLPTEELSSSSQVNEMPAPRVRKTLVGVAI